MMWFILTVVILYILTGIGSLTLLVKSEDLISEPWHLACRVVLAAGMVSWGIHILLSNTP